MAELHSAEEELSTAGKNSFTTGKSQLACESCRRRKAKCDRTMPCCAMCSKALLSCNYPSKRLKPGPKTGATTGRQRKRQHRNDSIDERKHEIEENYSNLELGHEHLPAPSQRKKMDTALPNSSTERRLSFSSMEGPLIPLNKRDEASNSSDTAATNFVRAISLSSLIHPTHELHLSPSASSSSIRESGFFINLAGTQDLIIQVCQSLNLSINILQNLIDSYFENMTAFSLFHQPSFGNKIQEIKNSLHLKGLFAAIFSFSARFESSQSTTLNSTVERQSKLPSHEHFHNLAVQFVQEALAECEDEVPPLCLLQALILTTFHLLTRGVRGRAWRLLGSCVRIAYELRLHLVDYEGLVDPPKSSQDLASWIVDEERRRSWWTIWEMDVFASAIRRCPTAIDWNMNNTYLPIKDEFWFENQYHLSCVLERKPMERWKKLKKTGNESPWAWFILINSLMMNAQLLNHAKIKGILLDTDLDNSVAHLIHYFRNTFKEKRSEKDSTQLTILINALRCTTAVLPEVLTYNGESLSFSSSELDSIPEQGSHDSKRLHSAKYSIYMMTQLARFMIYHHYAFGEIVSGSLITNKPGGTEFGWTVTDQEGPTNCEGFRNCLQAADNILAIITRSSNNHVKFVNPFLSSTIWVGTSLQVLRKVFAPDAHTELTESKYEILRLSCQQFAQFWGTPLALLENLNTLEENLILRRNVSAGIERTVAIAAANVRTNTDNARSFSSGYNTTSCGRHNLTEKALTSVGSLTPVSKSAATLSQPPLPPLPPTQTDPTNVSALQDHLNSDVLPNSLNPRISGLEFSGEGTIRSLSDPQNDRNQAQTSSFKYIGEHGLSDSSFQNLSTGMPLDDITAGQDLGDEFTWYLAGLISESVSK